MPGREKRQRPRGSEEEFVLFLQGIPAHCRWQELKDLVRQTALHIRQAVVYDDHHGFPTGLGQIIVKNEEEAWRTYHRLSTNGWEGQTLVVTLSRTCAPTRPIAGPTKSPACAFPSSYASGYSTPPRVSQTMAPASPMSPEPVMPTTPPTYQNPEYVPIIGLPPPSFIPVFADALSPPPAISTTPNTAAAAAPGTFCDPLPFPFALLPRYPPQPLHETPVTSAHMNGHEYPGKTNSHTPRTPTSTSTTPTRRTILVQDLDPNATRNDLTKSFREAGSIDQCQIQDANESSNRYNNRSSAKVTFNTPNEAKRAVSLFHNTRFMGSKRIRVRVDRAPSPSPSPGAGAGTGGISTTDTATDHVPTEPGTGPGPGPGPKSVDRCQPFVVNGSGIGRNANGVNAVAA